MALRTSTRIHLAVILVATHGIAGAAERVYLTAYTSSGLPIYTNRPMQPEPRRKAATAASLAGAGSAETLFAATQAAAVRGGRPKPDLSVDSLIQLAARTHGIEEALLRAVIDVESGFNPAARSRSGALGLMQLMPDTARRYGVTDARDAAQNIRGGALYLKDLLERFGGNVRLALAAYNAGEGAVIRYGHRVPPFAETQVYVPTVLDRYRSYVAQASAREAGRQR